ncbi:hypothetical protein KO465_06080 [Candidatus Micrarchaeota archaeon]|jgi:hypothetical protein|nr:hypothetical protein [Candidatus Micrarchaeota archaeon]
MIKRNIVRTRKLPVKKFLEKEESLLDEKPKNRIQIAEDLKKRIDDEGLLNVVKSMKEKKSTSDLDF